MINIHTLSIRKCFEFFFLAICFLLALSSAAQNSFTEYQGVVRDAETGNELIFATIAVTNSNLSTITNADGEFLLKIPDELKDENVIFSFLGYYKESMPVTELSPAGNEISLRPAAIELEEVSLSGAGSARDLVLEMLKRKATNYIDQPVKMTAFYRETIKKRRRDASLAEAVVFIYKQPNERGRNDAIELYKSRKSTNYDRLDTIALKLQGGPYTPLYTDMMKYPQYIFDQNLINNYLFTYGNPSVINGRNAYVVEFEQRPGIEEPLHYGKLFIDAQSYALISAVYNLNLENREEAASFMVRKKPANYEVWPTEAAYRVDYRIKEGLWYYGYGNVQLAFVVDEKGKLFNSKYYVSSEMAVTDWAPVDDEDIIRRRDQLRPSVIIADEISGFSDPDFWGAYNVIEPDKSIESAIDKIQREIRND
ncbi:carboxypeptidase-like regulatory domain-containing protein [Robertkochia aurantiaca]|uniref:carboxypeptidase-like regulatory domain-containing protein n=1 Tax=Robertkochia aurantiaca TaxID=2873700 RepID=UPI001CCB915C|nr:carboxypeptidase-like regulatory domain-containing protein [Robertkochia sp. 3YJGBD-33]